MFHVFQISEEQKRNTIIPYVKKVTKRKIYFKMFISAIYVRKNQENKTKNKKK